MRPPALSWCRASAKKRGLSSAGRAPDLHSGGHRFDPDRLHQLSLQNIIDCITKAAKRVWSSNRTEIDIVQRETSVSLVLPSVEGSGVCLRRRGPKAILFSKSSTLTGATLLNQRVARWESTCIWSSWAGLKWSIASKSGSSGFAVRQCDHVNGLAFSGSDQARKGRLVDALAVRGDEGRDTLR